jgi:hypothetical protein
MGNIVEAVKRIQTLAFVGFDKVNVISIDHIPDEMTEFPDGNGGYWKRLQVDDEDVDSCQYKAKKGHVFKSHKHRNVEIAVCIGSFKIDTPFDSFVVDRNGTYRVDQGVPHRVTWLTDGSLILVFSPKFKNGGWESETENFDEN